MGKVEDLLGDGRLLKQVLVEGDGPVPKAGRNVEVHYETVVAATGEKIDSSWDRQDPFDFALGEGDVLEAWDIGVATMRGGERSEFTADASLAYAEDGGGDDIPPGATLRFVIELLTGRISQEAPAAPSEAKATGLPGEAVRLNRAMEAKDRGNDLAKEQDFAGASAAYSEAMGLIRAWRGTEAHLLKARGQLRLSCLLNLAQMDLKLKDFDAAVRHASEALKVEPSNCKAYYRRGIAHLAGSNLPQAKADLWEAARQNPKSGDIRSAIEELRQKELEYVHWQKEHFGGVFGKAPEQHVTERDLDTLPRVWLDVQIGASEVHRVHIVLYSDTVPRTAENFRQLCTGQKGYGRCGQPLHFKKTCVHKVVKGSAIECGDIQNYDGTGGESIYGETFEDENFVDTHHKRGLLSMVNRGPDTNDSKFMITLRSLLRLDGKNVVFGEVVRGMYVIDEAEAIETEYPDRPKTQVAIVDCGEDGLRG